MSEVRINIEPMQLGRYYKVPAVLVDDWRGFTGWIPVIGPMHEDAQIIGFPYPHFHIDWRFARLDIYQSSHRRDSFSLRSDERFVYNWTVQCPNRHGERVILRGPEPRYMRFKRELPRFPHEAASWMSKLTETYACAKLIDGVCPHRGIPVSAMIRNGDVLTCPGHGLKWHAITGEAIFWGTHSGHCAQ